MFFMIAQTWKWSWPLSHVNIRVRCMSCLQLEEGGLLLFRTPTRQRCLPGSALCCIRLLSSRRPSPEVPFLCCDLCLQKKNPAKGTLAEGGKEVQHNVCELSSFHLSTAISSDIQHRKGAYLGAPFFWCRLATSQGSLPGVPFLWCEARVPPRGT